ncbi:N-acetylmuramoyl-L-alanine amidase [Pseudoxanthomonas sp. GM95]|uniref:N-acetylmuramoyl-L-alanine amidase n=1 Tax=Pseudoxanthomonas sp. GM95 TaxID=1881043 RepID=UPI0008C2EC7F|nr:N-acetylmuramoyl-L-alanine amidase [Pseudoxanthomonas sp. GM95]SEK40120.1 N-acetylmuramoyl-L-alanine amidase [Pseudoxanthomonas sp. GM95]
MTFRLPLRPRAALLLLGVLALSACAGLPAKNPLAQWEKSPNQNKRGPVLIVLHYTDQHSAEESLKTLKTANSKGPVSAHYLIGEDGKRYQLVSDDRRAWHAGAGRWGTITDVNSASIGIELDNDGHTPFSQAQIDSLILLLDDLCKRHRMPRTAIIGHEDMAPGRKVDPGPLFPWKQLADAGFGRWPRADAPPAPADFDPWLAMATLGYPLTNRGDAVQSFRHHFRGMEGRTFDAEDLRILHDLTLPPPAVAGEEDGM